VTVLAPRMPWAQTEASLAPLFSHKDRAGLVVEDADLFGPSLAPATQIALEGEAQRRSMTTSDRSTTADRMLVFAGL